MAGERLQYRDFQERVSIQDVLKDAGYTQNKRDGLRYPSYSRRGSDGNRISGDKFIVTRNGLCCFRPPEDKRYNVISFIKSFPENFRDYRPGIDTDRLVNLVCNRLLNQPIEVRLPISVARPDVKFDIKDYKLQTFKTSDWESQKAFYPYFKGRGIDLPTQRAFAGHFFLATSDRGFTNLSFPLSNPDCPGKQIVGFEERSRPNGEGKCAYKGLAKGSDAANGLWIARLENGRSDQGFSRPLSEHPSVYWFESAYDAMAYYQIHLDKEDLRDAVFVSTSGNPSRGQEDGMAKATPNARHVLCFDADDAGEKFARNFYMNHPDLKVVRDVPDPQYKDWNEQLLGELNRDRSQEVEQSKGMRR